MIFLLFTDLYMGMHNINDTFRANMSTDKCFKQTANLLSLGSHVCRHVVRSSFDRLLLIISSRDCREADSRDTSPRHACLGEVSRKIWLHDFAINNNGGSVPVIFISLGKSKYDRKLTELNVETTRIRSRVNGVSVYQFILWSKLILQHSV